MPRRRITNRQSTHAMRSFMGTVCSLYAFNYETKVIELKDTDEYIPPHMALTVLTCTTKAITFGMEEEKMFSSLCNQAPQALLSFFLSKGYKCTMQAHTCTVYWH